MRSFFAAVVAITACGSFGTTPTGTPPTDGGEGDASFDAIPDAVPATPFCATAPKDAFCADFENVNAVADGWSEMNADNSGTLTLVDGRDRIGQALRAFLPAGSGSCRRAQLLHTSKTATTKPRVELDFVVVENGPSAVLRIGHVNGCAIDIAIDASPGVYIELDPLGKDGGDLAFPRPFPLGQWIHGVVEVDFQGLTYTVTLDHLQSTVTGTLPSSCQKSDRVHTLVGLHCSRESSAPLEVKVDNVLITPR